MIKQIKLKNFQCHRDLSIELTPGVNILAAPTNKGKSAVVRAIRWLVEHKPVTGLVRHGEDSMSVTLETDNGTVTRFKTKSGNGYDVDGQRYLATGTIQPIPVKQVLQIEDINFQGQHDAPFLLRLTPGQLARELNRIVDLEVIDKANSTVASGLRGCEMLLEAQTTIAESTKARVEALEWASAASDELEALDTGADALEASKAKLGALDEAYQNVLDCQGLIAERVPLILGLEALIVDIRVLEAKRAKAASLAEKETKLLTSRAAVAKTNEMGRILAALVKMQSSIEPKTKKIREVQALVTGIKDLQSRIATVHPDLAALEYMINRQRFCVEQVTKLNELVQSAKNCRDKIMSSAVAIKQAEVMIEQKQKEARVCPSCKRPL